VNLATMTPEQLAEHGIPAVMALRARLGEVERLVRPATGRERYTLDGQRIAYADALAILEAKAQ
jgi:hypothetical protein